jgi:hypothetical protein
MTKIQFSEKNNWWICIPSLGYWNLKANCWLKWSRLNSQNLTFNLIIYTTNLKSSSTRLFLAETYSKPRAASISSTWISSKILLVLLVKRMIYYCFVFLKRSCLECSTETPGTFSVPRSLWRSNFSIITEKRNNHYIRRAFSTPSTCYCKCFRTNFLIKWGWHYGSSPLRWSIVKIQAILQKKN